MGLIDRDVTILKKMHYIRTKFLKTGI